MTDKSILAIVILIGIYFFLVDTKVNCPYSVGDMIELQHYNGNLDTVRVDKIHIHNKSETHLVVTKIKMGEKIKTYKMIDPKTYKKYKILSDG